MIPNARGSSYEEREIHARASAREDFPDAVLRYAADSLRLVLSLDVDPAGDLP